MNGSGRRPLPPRHDIPVLHLVSSIRHIERGSFVSLVPTYLAVPGSSSSPSTSSAASTSSAPSTLSAASTSSGDGTPSAPSTSSVPSPSDIADDESLTKEERLLKLSECPGCQNYVTPPIRQCCLGHVLCPSCFRGLPQCPVCHKEKTPARAFLLEEIHKYLTFPCRFKNEGCDTVDKGIVIRNHEKTCKYRKWRCPLDIFSTCKFEGSKEQFLDHIYQVHPGGVFKTIERTFLSRGQLPGAAALFHVYDTIFILSWRWSSKCEMIVIVDVLEEEDYREKKFGYELLFYLHGNDIKETAMYRGYCSYLPVDGVREGDNDIAKIDSPLLEKSAKQEIPLYHRVKIINNQSSEEGYISINNSKRLRQV